MRLTGIEPAIYRLKAGCHTTWLQTQFSFLFLYLTLSFHILFPPAGLFISASKKRPPFTVRSVTAGVPADDIAIRKKGQTYLLCSALSIHSPRMSVQPFRVFFVKNCIVFVGICQEKTIFRALYA